MSQDIFTFLQKTEVSVSPYVKFADGDKRSLRILSKPVTGFETWVEDPEGNRRPVRWKPDEQRPEHAENTERAKKFVAFVVFEYSEDGKGGDVKIWQFSQRSIIDQMAMLFKDRHWSEYELVVVRAGKGLDTKYNVTGIQSPIEQNLVAFASECDKYVNLQHLFSGDSPFLEELPSISVAQPKPQSNDLPF